MNQKKEFQEKINDLNTLIYNYCVAKRANLTKPYIDISNKIILTSSVFSILLAFIIFERIAVEGNIALNIFIFSFAVFYPISIYLERETSFFKYLMNHSESDKVFRYYYDYLKVKNEEIEVKRNRVLFEYIVDWIMSSTPIPFLLAGLLTASMSAFIFSNGLILTTFSIIIFILFCVLFCFYTKNSIQKTKERKSSLINEKRMVEIKKEISIKLNELKDNEKKTDSIRQLLELKKKRSDIEFNYSFFDDLIENEISLLLKNNKMKSLEDYILNMEVKNINMTNE